MKKNCRGIYVYIVILCFLAIMFLLYSYVKDAEELYESSLNQFSDIVIKVKEDRMREVVERTINEIDNEREIILDQCERLFKNIEIINNRVLTEENIIDIYKRIDNELVDVYPHLLIKYILINPENNEIITSNDENFLSGISVNEDEFNNYKTTFKYSIEYKFLEKDIDLIIGITESDIDNSVKIISMDKIRNTALLDYGYIWVNEIIDFNGGDDYARRLIHPNLPETEGMMLSTNFEDIKGNRPYKEELNQINNSGEALLEYYFKKNGNDEVAKKFSYLKLYPEYNWVIGTGIYMDDLESFIDKNTTEFKIQVKKQIIVTALTAVILFIVAGILGSSVFYYYEVKKRQLITKENEIIKRHYNLLENKYDKTNEIIHDIKNHLISIHGLAVKDNNDIISKYVKSINNDISQLGYMIVTGNKILDIILNEKIYIIKKNEIDFKHYIENTNLDFIEYKDIVTILTNLLDNSIESCILSRNKEINLSLYSFNNNFIVIKLYNTCENKPVTMRGTLLTSKKNKLYHGYGLKNVKNIVDKYSGNLNWSYDEIYNKFTVVVMIPKV